MSEDSFDCHHCVTDFHGVELGSLPNIHSRGLVYLASDGNPVTFKKAQGDRGFS